MEQPEDLRNFVLVIKDTQDGDAAHTWLPMSEFNWPEPTGVDTRPEIESHVEPAALKDRDCEQEQLDCFSRCWKRKPPYPRERNKQGHYAYCQEKCLKEYMECLKATGRAPTRIQGHG